MNNLVIVRFGNLKPTKPETILLNEIAKEHALCCTLGTIGIVSIIQTELSLQEVSQLYQDLGKDLDDSYPVIISRLGESAFDFGPMVPQFTTMVDAFKESIGEKTYYTIDQLLDKISQVGYDSLTGEEKKALDNLSK